MSLQKLEIAPYGVPRDTKHRGQLDDRYMAFDTHVVDKPTLPRARQNSIIRPDRHRLLS
jgi:hypothetical protein